jgi:hypothetical protein
MLCSVEFDEIANNISGIYLKQIHSYVDQVFSGLMNIIQGTVMIIANMQTNSSHIVI